MNALQPERVKRRRRVETETGDEAGWEEYVDYIFPDKQNNQPNLKLLAMAKRWKEQKERQQNLLSNATDYPTNNPDNGTEEIVDNEEVDDEDDDDEEFSSSSDSD